MEIWKGGCDNLKLGMVGDTETDMWKKGYQLKCITMKEIIRKNIYYLV